MQLPLTARRLVAGSTVLALTALGGGAVSATGRPGVAPASDNWTTYHYTQDRHGYDPLAATASGRLTTAWATPLDGAVYAEPLVIDEHVIVVTENDSMYSLSLAGDVEWRQHVGTPVPLSELPCGNIDPLGMTGTPIYSARTGLVYVAAELDNPIRHRLFALNALTGNLVWSRTLDQDAMVVETHQQRAALAIAHGRVWVSFGGLAGDCGQYHGWVIGNALDGTGTTKAYQQPSDREAGIWAPSGPAVDADGNLFVAVGNGSALQPPYDDSDSVLKLHGATKVDLFAPSNWAEENATDKDLGSTGPLLFDAFGQKFAFADGKEGTGYLLNQTDLGGVGGQLSTISDCRSWGGMAFHHGVIYVPCINGLSAYSIKPSPHLHKEWRNHQVNFGASPVLGGGALWAVDDELLYQLDPDSGRTVATIGVGVTPHFATPTLHGSLVLVGTMSGVTAISTS